MRVARTYFMLSELAATCYILPVSCNLLPVSSWVLFTQAMLMMANANMAQKQPTTQLDDLSDGSELLREHTLPCISLRQRGAYKVSELQISYKYNFAKKF